MAVSVMTYNTLDAFSDPQRSTDLIDFIEAEAPNLAFFSEAYASRHCEDKPLKLALGSLANMGYGIVHHQYDDSDNRNDRHGFIGIANIRRSHGTVHRFHTRNGVRFNSQDPDSRKLLNFYGVHLDDRSEAGRLAQLEDFQPDTPNIILAGDLNAMHKNTKVSKILRATKPFADLLPAGTPGEKQSKLERIGSLSKRLTQMAAGTTLEELSLRGLYDADAEHHTPTMTVAGRPLFQLDHLLHTDTVQLLGEVKVHNDITLSDHKAVSGTFAVA